MQCAELKFNIFERKLLAVYFSIKHFRHFVEGQDFLVRTDHKPLTYALSMYSACHSSRQAQHLVCISHFNTDLRYNSGADNAAADNLSRIKANALS